MSNNNEKLKCRKVRAILRYHVPNQNKRAEEYVHHLLFMYYPFRNEEELHQETYMENLLNPEVMRVIDNNKIKIEPFGNLVETALSNLRSNLTLNQDSYAQQENDEVETLIDTANALSEDADDDAVLFDDIANAIVPLPVLPTILPDDEINKMICSLNFKQRQIFDVIMKWSRDHIKYLSCIQKKTIDPIHLLITGDGGCGKSHLAKTIFNALSKTMSYHAGNPEKPKVLMLAPTGVAAVNVAGATIHSGLGIPVGCYGETIPKLNDKTRCKLRNNLSSVKVILIDEISMVSNILLLHIHQRLIEILGTSEELPFAGLSIIAFGDLYQLPPINQRPIYSEYKDPLLNILPLWRLFKIAELNEVMRQKGDTVFIDLLNKVRVGNIDAEVESILKSRFLLKHHPNYPVNAMHTWAENAPAFIHNNERLNGIDGNLYVINSTDLLPKNVRPSLIEKALSRSQMQTGGLAGALSLKIGALVMLTTNIDVLDKLSNGQTGTVAHIKLENGNVVTIYVKLDDESAGLKLINSDIVAKRITAIPLKRTEATINIHPNKTNPPAIKRTQFSLMLAWACTVHKVQGKQFKEAVISFELFKQRRFNNGQIYVGLSKVTSLDGLYLTGEFSCKAVNADARATEEYTLLRNEYSMIPIKDCEELSQNSLTVCLLNARSFRKHVKDIKSDNFFTQCDVLCITESHVEEQAHVQAIQDDMGENWNIIHNINTDKYSSIAVCLHRKYSIVLCNVYHIPAATLISLEKEGMQHPIHILLIYRKSSTANNDFCYMIRHMNSIVGNDINIILGDFNIDGYKENTDLKTFLNTVTDLQCIVKGIFFLIMIL